MKKIILWSLVLFTVWLALTGTFQIQEVLTGILVSVIISILYVKGFALNKNNKICFISIVSYIVLLIKNLIASNISIAKRILSPTLKVNPGIVSIQTTLKEDWKKLILANSITLTPGTLTIDINEDNLFIHWIDIDTNEQEKMEKEIKSGFEEAISQI